MDNKARKTRTITVILTCNRHKSVNDLRSFGFSSPGRSPGRTIVLPPASALALESALAAASALAKC